jgi:hypothetical protein
MKSLILAAAFAASLAIGLPSAAEARTTVHIFFGYPHYSYRVGPGYVYRPGYGWYWPGYRNRGYARLSCGEAKWRVRNHGYRNVSTIECRGATYTFRGMRNGRGYRLFVNSRSGAVWRG